MSGLDSFAIILICLGAGIVLGCCGTYMIYCCAKICSKEIPKEPENSLYNNPMFQNKNLPNEDPVPP